MSDWLVVRASCYLAAGDDSISPGGDRKLVKSNRYGKTKLVHSLCATFPISHHRTCFAELMTVSLKGTVSRIVH